MGFLWGWEAMKPRKVTFGAFSPRSCRPCTPTHHVGRAKTGPPTCDRAAATAVAPAGDFSWPYGREGGPGPRSGGLGWSGGTSGCGTCCIKPVLLGCAAFCAVGKYPCFAGKRRFPL